MSKEDDLMAALKDDEKKAEPSKKKEEALKKAIKEEKEPVKEAKKEEYASHKGPMNPLIYVLIMAVIAVVIFIGIYYYALGSSPDNSAVAPTPSQPINVVSEKKMDAQTKAKLADCCTQCTSFGKYVDVKSCSSIIAQNRGQAECKLIFANHPRTYAQCLNQ